ncbi:MAG: hypothetical protein Q7K37_11485 [Dehalococcoidia bacterium]|nr:hypothetical protein [Dehalococcoidia bacterium]
MALTVLSLLAAVSCGSQDGGNTGATATVIATASPTPTASTSPSPTVAEPPAPTPQIDFERTGNLVRDNPGLPPGVWFLLYEEPGAPALTAELEFAAESSCVAEAQVIPCDALEPGSRVVVAGVQSGQRVRVVRLDVIAAP